MKLNEMFGYGESGFEQQKNYDADQDISILDSEDTRKTRLTFKDINRMRLASEHHDQEQKAESEFVQKMYAQPQAEDNISL